MKNRKLRIAAYFLAIITLLITVVLYPSLPDRIPMTWRSNGTVSYEDKYHIFFMSGMGILFLFIGNILPKVKSNFYMGIKTPWALSSEEVWRKTHRLGGKCFFLAGIAITVSSFLPHQEPVFRITFACIMAACLIPGIMSYIWWRQEQNKE